MCIPFTVEGSSQDNKITTPEATFWNLATAPASVLTSGSQGIHMCIYMHMCNRLINCVSFFLRNLQSNTTARQL